MKITVVIERSNGTTFEQQVIAYDGDIKTCLRELQARLGKEYLIVGCYE